MLNANTNENIEEYTFVILKSGGPIMWIVDTYPDIEEVLCRWNIASYENNHASGTDEHIFSIAVLSKLTSLTLEDVKSAIY